MSIEQQLEADIKQAMLARDSVRTTTLRTLKSVFLSAKVAAGTRDSGLPDDQAIALLAKEAKKRQESIEMYEKGDSPERAAAEKAEKTIIEGYLPAQLSAEDIATIADEVIASLPEPAMGPVIAGVKQRTAGAADGALIAQIVREKLQK